MKNEESVVLRPSKPAVSVAEVVVDYTGMSRLLNVFVSDDGSEEWRKTWMCLANLYGERMKLGMPHAFSAERLENEVLRCDCLGPVHLGLFYPRQLRYECQILIPRMLSVEDLPGWQRLLFTWNQSGGFFRCVTIGPVLQIYKMALEKRWNANAGL